MFVAVGVAKMFFITCAKQNGKFSNIVWNTLKATQKIARMIQVGRSDAGLIILFIIWPSRLYSHPLQK